MGGSITAKKFAALLTREKGGGGGGVSTASILLYHVYVSIGSRMIIQPKERASFSHL